MIVFALLTQNVVSAQIQTTPALSVRQVSQESQTTNCTTNEDLKAFIAQEEAKPLPDNYEIPSYIISGKKVEDVFNTLKARYPEFFDISKTQMIDAVNGNTDRYTKMMNENKAIRKQYNLR
jgi:hypothetical protein